LANHYKGADGKCKLCIGGASSAGGAVSTCSCSSAGSSYDTSVAYKEATGCTCATGYAKPSGDDDGECSECASGYEYKASGNSFTCTMCVGDQITTSGKDSCSCPNTPAYSGQKDSSGCGERVMPCIVKAVGHAGDSVAGYTCWWAWHLASPAPALLLQPAPMVMSRAATASAAVSGISTSCKLRDSGTPESCEVDACCDANRVCVVPKPATAAFPAACATEYKYVAGANSAFTCERCPGGSLAGGDKAACECPTSSPYNGGQASDGCSERPVAGLGMVSASGRTADAACRGQAEHGFRLGAWPSPAPGLRAAAPACSLRYRLRQERHLCCWHLHW
jgi:hypothetical protein